MSMLYTILPESVHPLSGLLTAVKRRKKACKRRPFCHLKNERISMSAEIEEAAPAPVQRVQCFIDGYNLYHGIEEAGDPCSHWVDLRKLCERYVPKAAVVNDVFWFSAKPTHLSQKINQNYDNYAKALNMSGVSLIGGKFKRKNAKCEVATGCGQAFYKHEEKESDVNLAVSLVANACIDNFDIAIVITADSDLCPPIKYVRDNFPHKEVWLIAPPKRINRAKDLCNIATRNFEINSGALRACLMRDSFSQAGAVVAVRPQEWRHTPNRGRRNHQR